MAAIIHHLRKMRLSLARLCWRIGCLFLISIPSNSPRCSNSRINILQKTNRLIPLTTIAITRNRIRRAMTIQSLLLRHHPHHRMTTRTTSLFHNHSTNPRHRLGTMPLRVRNHLPQILLLIRMIRPEPRRQIPIETAPRRSHHPIHQRAAQNLHLKAMSHRDPSTVPPALMPHPKGAPPVLQHQSCPRENSNRIPRRVLAAPSGKNQPFPDFRESFTRTSSALATPLRRRSFRPAQSPSPLGQPRLAWHRTEREQSFPRSPAYRKIGRLSCQRTRIKPPPITTRERRKRITDRMRKMSRMKSGSSSFFSSLKTETCSCSLRFGS